MNRFFSIIAISCMLSFYKVVFSNIIFNIIDGNPDLIFKNINPLVEFDSLSLIMFLLIATTVFPLIWELLFRGLLWGFLSSFADRWTTGIIVAVAYSLFGMILNFPFLLPFALYLSYLRYSTDSIWPGVFANSVFAASGILMPFMFSILFL